MRTSKTGTVALVVRCDEPSPTLVATISDEQEIALLEAGLDSGDPEPLEAVISLRERQTKEDEEFGDYVEDLLSQPFVRPEIQEHGVQWLMSKIRIEEFKRTESEATQVIATYAFKLFQDDPSRTEFFLAGPAAKVKIRIFTLPIVKAQPRAA